MKHLTRALNSIMLTLLVDLHRPSGKHSPVSCPGAARPESPANLPSTSLTRAEHLLLTPTFEVDSNTYSHGHILCTPGLVVAPSVIRVPVI